MKKQLIFLFPVFWLMVSCQKDKPSADKIRHFFMGFSPFPYDYTLQAVEESYQNTIRDSDIILVHFDSGVPWNEALNGTDFPDTVQNDIDQVNQFVPDGHKILLTATPTDISRSALADYWNNDGTHQPLPPPWDTYTFNTPDVITAYINYCHRLIDNINPDYFAFGIEVNADFKAGTDNYNAFKSLMQIVYQDLKQNYPELPVFMTFQDQSFNKTRQELLDMTSELLHYSDMIAVSTYPFWLYNSPNDDSNPDNINIYYPNWLEEMRNLNPDKPFAVSETGYIAEDLILPSYGINIEGNAEWQKEFMEKLLQKSNDLHAIFVCWFVYRDYDNLYENISNPAEFMKIWKDNGLLDGDGNTRPAYNIWKEWLSYQVVQDNL